MIDAIIILSLERRKDRKEILSKHLDDIKIKDLNVPIYWLPAFDGAKIKSPVKIIPKPRPYFSFNDENGLPSNSLNKYQISCSLTHIAGLKFAKMLNLNSVLLLEDDVHLIDDFVNKLIELEKEIKNNNIYWEHIYLGGAERIPNNNKFISTHLRKPTFTDGLHAYLVHKNGYNKIINGMYSFVTTNDDVINDLIYKKDKPLISYFYYPKLSYQIESFSELDRRIFNRTDFKT